MVGLGFAMSENVSYYLAALTENGPEGLAATVVLARGCSRPFAHPLFTSLIGIAVAYAAQPQNRGARGVWMVIFGWIGAMILHGLWNGFASFSGFNGLIVAYLILMALLFLELWVIVRDRKRVVGMIQHYLPPYERTGLITRRRHRHALLAETPARGPQVGAHPRRAARAAGDERLPARRDRARAAPRAGGARRGLRRRLPEDPAVAGRPHGLLARHVPGAAALQQMVVPPWHY